MCRLFLTISFSATVGGNLLFSTSFDCRKNWLYCSIYIVYNKIARWELVVSSDPLRMGFWVNMTSCKCSVSRNAIGRNCRKASAMS